MILKKNMKKRKKRTKMNKLEMIAEELKKEENETKIIETKNKETEGIGCASICQDGRIAVYEGNPDGSDDKIMTAEEFIKNYEFEMVEEW